ncbi:MAG TPA: anthranilate synthase component I [Candidatus Hydrogenedentes bacterium]|nr:anthranilate synthase component I [Candidatus Hydrogenedentota bacterium]
MYPSIEAFRAMARPHAVIPVYEEILADLETPVTAYLKLSKDTDHAFLLESVEKTDVIGRYSFLGAAPSVIFRSKGNRGEILRNGVTESFETDDPLGWLRELVKTYQPIPVDGVPGFHGGAVGYISYDTVRFFEKLPDLKPDPLYLPDLYFMITDTLVVFDHVRNKIQIISNAHVDGEADAAYNEAARKIMEIRQKLRGPLMVSTEKMHHATAEPPIESNFSREDFCNAVRKAKEYICAGDIFQVVLSQRFRRPVFARPVNLYRALRCINPSPYMLLLEFPDFSLVGSSPEVMTQVKSRRCMVRPIAGTRRRGATVEEDLALEKELLADEKEIAEHIMLVDLGRNDVGRVSKPGTVAPVPGKLMVIERYSHVMHIVSEVAGEMADGVDAFDAIRATFPMGTVSGAPKIRAMEIIEELEPERRGPYAGGCGYISYNGDMDTCILIRTMVVKNGVAYLQAGAGVVYDSDPEREYEETVNKAMALFRAVEFAEKGLKP